jgi:hypothetical protein
MSFQILLLVAKMGQLLLAGNNADLPPCFLEKEIVFQQRLNIIDRLVSFLYQRIFSRETT